MVYDMWVEHPPALADLIREALEGNDFGFLRGIQCFSEATRWTRLEGMESIINTLFETSIKMKQDGVNQRRYLGEMESFLREHGLYEKVEERADILESMYIPFPELKSKCQDLSQRQFLLNIQRLEDYGFIETDRSGGWLDSMVWLPPRYWNGIIEDTLRRGHEDSIYTSALGTMIAHACQNKTVATLKVIVLALNKHGEEIDRKDFEEEYISHGVSVRKMINFMKRDSQKNEQIKAIPRADERVLRFNREMVRTNERWLNRTRERTRRRRGP